VAEQPSISASYRVGLVFQPVVEGAQELARACASVLRGWGQETVVLSAADLGPDQSADAFRLVVTFGGDGTILRTARWLAGRRVPIVGVQMGRLGFLAELLPTEVPEGLRAYLDGDCWLDQRAMLQAEVIRSVDSPSGAGPDPSHRTTSRGGGVEGLLALNDIVVGRGQSLRTVTVDLSMDGYLLHRFRCDGLVVATSTGSTAYSFAAGGPVMAPASTQVVVTAICPHISMLRSLVLAGDTPLSLQVWASQPAVVTIDGQIDHVLESGDVVEARRSECATTFARRGTPAEFYSKVLRKLT
jgi:NAD+ kinase